MTTKANFHQAAQRVQERFRKMFPHAPAHLATLSDIKHRWYYRGTAHVMRERFGHRS